MLPSLTRLRLDDAADTNGKKSERRYGPRLVNPPLSPASVRRQQLKAQRKSEWNERFGSGPEAERIWKTISRYDEEALKEYFAITKTAPLAPYSSLLKFFPLNTTISVDSATALIGFQWEMATSMLFPDVAAVLSNLREKRRPQTSGSHLFWMFSCNPAWNEGKIQVVCADPSGLWDNEQSTSAAGIVKGMQTAFAFEQNTDGADFCGASNCFFKDIEIPATATKLNELKREQEEDVLGTPQKGRVQTIVATMAIQKFQPGDTAPPPRVGVRAPSDKKRVRSLYNHVKRQLNELFLTLEMARVGITPPVYAAVPVFKRGTNFTYATVFDSETVHLGMSSNFGFAYIGEAGWENLDIALQKWRFPSQQAELAKAVLECVKTTSNNFVLLMDVKPLNMIAKQTELGYVVKMIDFDAKFSVNVNRFGTGVELGHTSSDCVFFVNGLLLLNSSFYRYREFRNAFADLAIEVAATWYAMKELNKLSVFCAYLAQDRFFAERFPDRGFGKPPDLEEGALLLLPEDVFLDTLSRTFYNVLYHYGRRDNEHVQVYQYEMSYRDGTITPYVERILEDLRAAPEWSGGDLRAGAMRVGVGGWVRLAGGRSTPVADGLDAVQERMS